MTVEERDAEVCSLAGRRLFRESFEQFREAHEAAMRGFETLPLAELIECFGRALGQERRAIERQGEAIELQGRMIAARSGRLAAMKAALDG